MRAPTVSASSWQGSATSFIAIGRLRADVHDMALVLRGRAITISSVLAEKDMAGVGAWTTVITKGGVEALRDSTQGSDGGGDHREWGSGGGHPEEFQKIASKFGAKEELNAIDAAVDHTQPPADNRNVRSDEFDAAKEAKKLQEGALIEFLRERWEIFAWEPSDMPGIPRELAEHALNVDPTAKPVQQSMRRFSEPKRRAIGEEINRLRKAGFIRELKESEWVANPVMVPKKDTTALRMCIDYTGLNKHCPKDHFPLPIIDQIVDSTAGCDRLSFLDAYSGGIEANPLKIKAILDMEPPKNLHQVQQQERLALSSFIAKLGEKALPFYSLMKKSEKFEWTKEAQESFDNLKKILSTYPVLVTPREKETLLMYIAATAQVFSSVLVVEREEAGRVHGVQRPVYYLSEVLTPARQR
ncbi:hypothetical protein QYE76_044000 [Lolium multiflorum]|uniref:Reverse transcriptase/retrotransposon-derived protein RNase H-like domain-containing protein n=1 Tax=Lolium multiflorum TaxID=4521 RepID=A0AAD8TK30_LOLMU|nr:hypothetical protein QYE76_044000 [Lolium multiflorum]